MTRSTRTAALFILLATGGLAFAGQQDQAPTLAEGVCQAPFNLLVPAPAVRAAGGLTVIAHDDGAGGRLCFAIGPDEAVVTLQGEDGTTELARAQARLPGDGGQVVLKRTPGGVAVAYDSVTVLRAEAQLPDGGRWGVLGAQPRVLDEIILQPTDEIVFGDDFMRAPGQPATWDRLSGEWRVAQLESARFSANAFTLLGNASGDGPALAAAGYWFWEDLTVEASVRATRESEGFGVGLACQPDGSVHLLRFTPGGGAAGVLQLVRVRGGQEVVLDEREAVAHPDEWHRMAISGVEGRLAGALDGVELVSAEDPSLAHGQAALWVAGRDPVAFDDVKAYSGPRRTDEPVVLSYEAQASDPAAEAFINDQYMQEWADERGQWISGAGGVWHAGHYWGDVELAWELSERGLGDGVELHICVPAAGATLGPPADPAPGCHLALAATDGKLALSLREGAEARGEASVGMPELPATVALRRRGATVEALLAGEVVASFEAATPAAGKVGFTGRTARWQASALRIASRNMIDATFRAAPIEWHIGSGEWGVSSRWDCTPRWSWFQGRSEDLASVWTRRSFGGDVVVEFFAGISMDQPWAPFYQHPGNLCVTLCGSNDTPGSGYSFVFAGWGNSAAGIFRRGELVARAPGFTMPDILDSLGGTTGREDAHKLHNEWWRIRAERIGSTVRLLVDGKLAASFDDPEPLPGGAVGVWTLDQAMTVARARIYYEQSEVTVAPVSATAEASPRPGLPVPRFAPAHVASTFGQGVGGWGPAAPGACAVTLSERERDPDGRCLRVTNPTAGGRFALAAPFSGMDLREHPLLAFEYAIPEDVRIDVFATVGGQRHRVVLTGPEEPVPGIEDLGVVGSLPPSGTEGGRGEARRGDSPQPLPVPGRGVADGRWREARVDLLGLLRPFATSDGPITLEALEFAAYAAPEYMRAGIGGNPAGASWLLDNVYLGGVTDGPVRIETPRNWTVAAEGCSVTSERRAGRVEHRVTPRRGGVALLTVTDGPRSATDLVAFGIDLPAVEAPRAAPETPARDTPLAADFESDLGPIEPWGADAAVALRRSRNAVAGNPAGGEWALEARCTKLGGLFGVSLGCAPFEASRWPVLELDYRATDELRVDLIVQVDGSRRVVKFTDNDHTWRPIGSMEATADGSWHHATIDLHALLTRAFGRSAPLAVTEIAFATSGWPGNREGTRWWLDNVRLRARPEGPEAAPNEDGDPPTAFAPTPGDGERACPGAITVAVSDGGAGVSPADLALTVNGRTWTIADEALAWDGAGGLLTWRLPAGESLGGDGARVRCRLEARDLAGNVMEPLEWAFTVDHAADTQAPPAPIVSYLPARVADGNDFEEGTGGWGNFVDGQVLRRATGGATGPGCAQLRHLGGRGSGFVLVRDFGEGWREHPVVRFRYRTDSPTRARLQVLGTTFDGVRDRWTELGTLPIFGNGWLSAELDVARALARTSPSLDIHRIFLSIDLPPDGTLLVDDYAMYSPAASSAGFRWAEPVDPSGIAGYSWVLDSADDTVPPETINGSTLTAEFDGLEPGQYCFHLRACDGAGNWGPAAHLPFELTAPPSVEGVSTP